MLRILPSNNQIFLQKSTPELFTENVFNLTTTTASFYVKTTLADALSYINNLDTKISEFSKNSFFKKFSLSEMTKKDFLITLHKGSEMLAVYTKAEKYHINSLISSIATQSLTSTLKSVIYYDIFTALTTVNLHLHSVASHFSRHRLSTQNSTEFLEALLYVDLSTTYVTPGARFVNIQQSFTAIIASLTLLRLLDAFAFALDLVYGIYEYASIKYNLLFNIYVKQTLQVKLTDESSV